VALLSVVLGLPLWAASPDAGGKPILVFTATGTADIVEKLGKAFTKSSGTPVSVSSGGSPGLSRQILQGAPADLFIPTAITNLASLQQAGLVDEQSTFLWIRSRLVVIAPSQSAEPLATPQAIADPGFRRLALADPDRIPVGIYARQSLSYYRLWDALRERIVSLPDSRSVLTSVESGAADLGIVYASDARTSSRVKTVLEFSEESHKPIQYLVCLVAHSGASPAARPFLSFLKSDEARHLLVEAGFIPAFP
jgi:molybdate transport system substrate-binding protein